VLGAGAGPENSHHQDLECYVKSKV
jgi:hypothetical protein